MGHRMTRLSGAVRGKGRAFESASGLLTRCEDVGRGCRNLSAVATRLATAGQRYGMGCPFQVERALAGPERCGVLSVGEAANPVQHPLTSAFKNRRPR